ncbi:MAG: hypothetical protein GXO25_03855 [Euryarchaeota archaeon]|nr:hypothetical protein [Euryarchaeota archaeon]
MNFKPWYSRAYAYLGVYMALVILISGPIMGLQLIFLILISLLVALYFIVEDEIVFYMYVFLALAMLAMDFVVRVPTLQNFAVMYLLMAPLLLHIIEMHFGRYGKIHTNTYMIYMLSIALSFLTVLIFLFVPRVLGTYVLVSAVIITLILYFMITFTPPDENEE